tara:strand:- start:2092 stop:2400 length:309 start_codon:yes stop_codon:yes gene_type:complete
MSDLKQNVVEALRCVYDPEMPSINILDLGLIYKIDVSEEGNVDIEHTLTSVVCPFADEICKSIEDAVKGVVGVSKVNRKLVFTPPFDINMIPEETKIILGLI